MGGGITAPSQAAFDGSGNLWIPNYGSTSIAEWTGTGTPFANSPFLLSSSQPRKAVIDHSGDVWVVFNNGLANELRRSGLS